jgi:hypothetical protein
LKGRPHSTTSKAQPRSGPLCKRKNIIVDVEKVLELARIYFETGSYEAAQRECLKKGTDMSCSGVTPESPPDAPEDGRAVDLRHRAERPRLFRGRIRPFNPTVYRFPSSRLMMTAAFAMS